MTRCVRSCAGLGTHDVDLLLHTTAQLAQPGVQLFIFLIAGFVLRLGHCSLLGVESAVDVIQRLLQIGLHLRQDGIVYGRALLTTTTGS